MQVNRSINKFMTNGLPRLLGPLLILIALPLGAIGGPICDSFMGLGYSGERGRYKSDHDGPIGEYADAARACVAEIKDRHPVAWRVLREMSYPGFARNKAAPPEPGRNRVRDDWGDRLPTDFPRDFSPGPLVENFLAIALEVDSGHACDRFRGPYNKAKMDPSEFERNRDAYWTDQHACLAEIILKREAELRSAYQKIRELAGSYEPALTHNLPTGAEFNLALSAAPRQANAKVGQ